MKFLLSLLTICFMSTLGLAQEKKGKISGTITDAENNPLEAATVQLLKADNRSLGKVAITGKNGTFEIEKLSAGKYILAVSAVGFKTTDSDIIEINLSNQDVRIKTISLVKTSKELGGVTVVAKRPLVEQKIDRTVINVEAAPTNAGASALEVLEKSPGISVSNDGAVSLKGKQGVIVLMDGKQTFLSPSDLANLLKNMPASALDQIEIMTNPPAKYDASGNAGIINIKTKKSKSDGFNGSISSGITVGLYKRDDSYLTPLRNNTSVNLNYRKKKLNIFGNLNYNYREGNGNLNLQRKFFSKAGDLDFSSSSVNAFNFRNNNYTAKAGFDYYADKKNVFGIVLNGFGFFGRPAPVGTQSIIDPDGNVVSLLKSTTLNKVTFWNYSANFNYKHSFDSAGREFTLDLDYASYDNRTESLLITDVYNGGGGKTGNLTLKGDIPGIINIYSLKSDYTHPLKGDMRFDAGVKLSYVTNDNKVDYQRMDNGSFVPDSRSNHFLYDENINAAYVSINKRWNKWSAQGGLRLENTNATGKQVTNDSTFKRKYTSLFPTFFVNYDADKNNSFTFSYGRRIGRPNYQDLNPFVWFLDSLTYRMGNPYLTPQYTHNFELRHSLKMGLSTSINYTTTDDVISQIMKQNTAEKITYATTDNVAKFRNIGLSINAPIKFTNWWNSNVFVNVFNNQYKGFYYNSFTGSNDKLDMEYNSYMINITNTFNFKKGWSGEISGFYRGKGIEQLTIAEPMYFLNLGAQKTVLKGDGTIRLGIRDSFHWQVFRGRTVYSDIDVNIYNKWDNRNVTLTFTYRFGKSSVAQARKRNSASGEEQNRAGGQN